MAAAFGDLSTRGAAPGFDGLCISPSLDLAISAPPSAWPASRLEFGQHIIVRIAREKMHAQIKSGGLQQSRQSRNGRLPTVSLICRDHRRRDSGSFAELPLAETTLSSRQLQKCCRRRKNIRRLCHNTIVLEI